MIKESNRNAGIPDKRELNRSLLVICTAAFLFPFMGSSLNLALPQISEAFGMKAVTLTWMATSYLIATAIFQVPFARMADIVGRRKVFLWGVFAFSILTGLCGLATSGAMLIALRFLSGVAAAMISGTNIAILTSLFPLEKRANALGINTAVVYAALAAGPFLGGLITYYFGWRGIFFVPAALGIAALALAGLFLKREWIESRGEKFDMAGAALYAAGLAGLIYGFSSLPSAQGMACLALGVVSFAAFVVYERSREFPVFNVRLFSGNRVFALSSLASLINYAATAAIAFMLSLYLQYVRGYDAHHAGLILITQACVQSVFSLVAGNLSALIAPSRLATAGMAIIVASLAGLVFIAADTPIWMLIVILLMLGVGFGIFSSPNTNVIMGSVEKKYYTQASAVTGTMRMTGQAISMGIAGMTISFYVGNRTMVPELYPLFLRSMKLTFLIFMLLCMVGVYASSVRNHKKTN